MEKDVTIDFLIQEQENRIGSLSLHGDMIAYYEYNDMQSYNNWVAKTIRFLELNYPNDKHIDDFISTSRLQLTPDQQQQLLAILKAFASFPTVIYDKNKQDGKGKSINVNTNINNSNSQSQSQSMAVDLFIEAIKDDLTGRQIKELKQIVENENGDIEKARPKIIDKLLSFGKDVASNIVANILTNPSIWNNLF